MSCIPLTVPQAPKFVDEYLSGNRIQHLKSIRNQSYAATEKLSLQRTQQRMQIRANADYGKEKNLAEHVLYTQDIRKKWGEKLRSSPFRVNLAQDRERALTSMEMRKAQELEEAVAAQRLRQKERNEVLVKALADIPLLDEARRQKRVMLEEEKRIKALKEVQRVEAIQRRKMRDADIIEHERLMRMERHRMRNKDVY
eukprot:PhF_6_TR23945/c0_g1_i1/m.33507